VTFARSRFVAANMVIVVFLTLIVTDGIPSLGLFHDRAKDWIDPALDVLGIWQGSWTVFTPTVDRENHHIEAYLDYDPGGSVQWRTPQWRQASAWEKLVRFREMKYSEQVNATTNPAVRQAFADFLADELRPVREAVPTSIVITYHSSFVEPPEEGDYQPLPAPEEHPFVKTLYSFEKSP
jgi:hypothetical protein